MELRVKKLCKERGLTLQALAEKVGSSQASISRISAGGNTTTETLEKLAIALGVSIQDLFAETSDTATCPHCGGTIRVTK